MKTIILGALLLLLAVATSASAYHTRFFIAEMREIKPSPNSIMSVIHLRGRLAPHEM
jgi:hypothetical protein